MIHAVGLDILGRRTRDLQTRQGRLIRGAHTDLLLQYSSSVGTSFYLCCSFSACFSSSCGLSGRAHGAFGAALVDGDGLYSSWHGGLRLSRLPPLSHHRLLQGHQEVGAFLLRFSSALRVNLSIDDEFMPVNLELWQPDHLISNLTCGLVNCPSCLGLEGLRWLH